VRRHHLQQLQTVVNVQLLLAVIFLPLIHREERIAFVGPQNQLASGDHKPEPLDIPSLGRREHSLTLNGAYRTEQISTELDLRFSIARKPAFTEVCSRVSRPASTGPSGCPPVLQRIARGWQN